MPNIDDLDEIRKERDELLSEMQDCHTVLDAAGIDAAHDQNQRLLYRVKQIADQLTAGGWGLDGVLTTLKGLIQDLEEGTQNAEKQDDS